MRSKYGPKAKFVVIGHSYSGEIALLFSKMFRKECVMCCCIDNPPHVLQFFEEAYRQLEPMKFSPEDLKNSLKRIKEFDNDEFKKLRDFVLFRAY